MKKTILIILTISINFICFSQNSLNESWSFGAGFSNFIINGDLKPTGSFINLGGYIYSDKMITPSVGFELKLSYSKLSGQGNDDSFSLYGTPLNETEFNGTTFEGETSIIYNLSNLFSKYHKNENRKFNFSALLGVGIHRYNSTLYNSKTNELIADFGDSPSENGTTTSFYYTSGINLKYKIFDNLDLEFRQNFNINEDDHLDAAVSKKSNLDYFFKTNIGITYHLNKKINKSFTWYNKSETFIEQNNNMDIDVSESEADDDNDGVINLYDIEENTPKDAVVYGNGVAIDADEDGIIDLYDKCPLEYSTSKTGCKKDKDSDHDGVIDLEDECPNTFAKTLNGCPQESKVIEVETVEKISEIETEEKISEVETEEKISEVETEEKISEVETEEKISEVETVEKISEIKTEEKISEIETVEKISEVETVEKISEVETEEGKYKKQIISDVNKNNTKHGNVYLDNSVNINDIDTSPIYPDCIGQVTQFDITNCIISSISKYVSLKYNELSSNRISGKVRVLFIVKEDGSTKVVNILGDHNLESKLELKDILETLPKIQPGTLKGIPVPVKYSLLFSL